MSEKEKTVFEGEREIPVYTECDLLVVGGGAAGHSAAVAAARAGERRLAYHFIGNARKRRQLMAVQRLILAEYPYIIRKLLQV